MKYFKLFACCILVRGAKRSLICDLQRQESVFIPNDMADIIHKLGNKQSVNDIIKEYGEENKKVIEEYIDYLDEKEYGFYCDKVEFDRFPVLNTDYQTSLSVTNSIIELKKETIGNLSIVAQLERLGCKDVALIFYEPLEIQDFNKIFSYFLDTKIKSLEITCKYQNKINDSFFIELNKNLNRLIRLTLYSAPVNKLEHWDDKLLFDRVFTTQNISSFKYCGVVDMKYFNTNTPKVIEAINHNSCLNQKISVDINGEIRNCPSMAQSFGNIKDTGLAAALNHKDFKKYRNITKDQVEVCKDCEFRYVCTDCRAYLEKPDNPYAKPLKCGYDPYTNTWEDWSTNPLKQQAINFYGMRDLY